MIYHFKNKDKKEPVKKSGKQQFADMISKGMSAIGTIFEIIDQVPNNTAKAQKMMKEAKEKSDELGLPFTMPVTAGDRMNYAIEVAATGISNTNPKLLVIALWLYRESGIMTLEDEDTDDRKQAFQAALQKLVGLLHESIKNDDFKR